MINQSKKLSSDRKEIIALREIRKALRDLEFGTLVISVQDGVVVQIERTSKKRLDYSVLDQVSDGEGI